MDNSRRYLELISQHLQENHAALLVGSGFSRNAVKSGPDVPDSPLWDDLTKIFIKKLSPVQKVDRELEKTDPLKLAEYVELAYGRPELDRLLLDNIRDSDYQPSHLHRKLLQLPWSDIFTTNYDTLLERASEELSEYSFSYVLNQNDLLGSSGMVRIIKLHGSFPSQRPFIITAEDYRTYPRKFAPFVNTVQQSLLENTLCMIGFSGDDPNFNNWIGWIRDNLGAENAPYMYLLLHESPSDTKKEWLRRKNIIPVDLSEIFPGMAVSSIYEKTLDYLCDRQRKFRETRQKWDTKAPVAMESPRTLSVKEALPILRENHETCPKTLTLPSEKLEYLRSVIVAPASRVLAEHCCLQDNSELDDELEYLYEYDWLRGKILLPIFKSDLKYYREILNRHEEVYTTHKSSIQLSLLRTFREYGNWIEWEELYEKLLSNDSHITQDQLHQLRWEECLYHFARYEFRQLEQKLNSWNVSVDMPLWALRKSGLLAEFGACERAHDLLQGAILAIRKRLSHQMKTDPFLLSVESAMMCLQSFISQARQDDEGCNGKRDGRQEETEFFDAQHRAQHKQHQVSWEERNAYFVPRLEAIWEPFHNYHIKSTFDFSRTKSSTRYQEDKDRILAFSFLRFREETGIPFRIRSVYSDKKAACGAAERIAEYMPQLAVLVIVRTDEPKEVENTITRGVLSSWTQEKADQNCQFYLDSILRTEGELAVEDWFHRNSFARLAANVLPEVLSVLCSKCSVNLLDKLLSLLEHLYTSPKKLCYQQTESLTKRLITAFPVHNRRELVKRLARFPLLNQEDEIAFYSFPNPFRFVPLDSDESNYTAQSGLPEIQLLLTTPCPDSRRNTVLDHLLYCFFHGLLTIEQKEILGEILWDKGELRVPNGWLRTICLKFDAPQGIDLREYLSERLTENIKGYAGSGIRANNDESILLELMNFSLHNCTAFLPEQISEIIAAFSRRMDSLSTNLSRTRDIIGIRNASASQLYGISHALWVLTACNQGWEPTEQDRQEMNNILSVCERVYVNHHGLKSIWTTMLEIPFCAERNLGQCLRSVDDLCSHYGYHVLATAIHYPALHLLSEKEICSGVSIMAQQIAWGIPKQLPAALQTAESLVRYQPKLMTGKILELVLSGLWQLIDQTVITSDDTVDLAAEKGCIRKEAASLARLLCIANLAGQQEDVLDKWHDITLDQSEFAEIRNVP